MSNLFIQGLFGSHSGKLLDWKIECDALTQVDWETIAHIVSKHIEFDYVVGIPNGGLKFAEALKKHINKNFSITLIVDDVYTTGQSMEEAKQQIGDNKIAMGVVLFARNPPPEWIKPIFQYGW